MQIFSLGGFHHPTAHQPICPTSPSTWQSWLQLPSNQGFWDVAHQGLLLKEMPAAALVHISCFIPSYSNGKMQGSPVSSVLHFGSSENESCSFPLVFDELNSTNDYLPWDIPLCNCPILKHCMLFHTTAFHPEWNLPWPRCTCCASSHQTRKGIHMGHSDHYELSLSSSILLLLRIIKYVGLWVDYLHIVRITFNLTIVCTVAPFRIFVLAVLSLFNCTPGLAAPLGVCIGPSAIIKGPPIVPERQNTGNPICGLICSAFV